MSTSLHTIDSSVNVGLKEDTPAPHIIKQPLHTIRNRSVGWGIDLALWWRYRSMVMLLVWRDMKVKYKQSALGGLWIILQPLGSVLMYTFIFGKLARMP